MVAIKINEITYQIPADLSEIPLGKFMTYYNNYGESLDKELTEIIERDYPDEFDRQLDLSAHEDREALSWFSFWTGLDLMILTSGQAIDLITLYRSIKTILTQSEKESYDLPEEIEWRDHIWEIKDFKVTPNSSFTFSELITSKEVVRQTKAIGKGKWTALPYLCAVFFRRKGEAFTNEMIEPESERLTAMHELPMHHAIKVAFFLSVSINIWRRALVSLKAVEEVLKQAS